MSINYDEEQKEFWRKSIAAHRYTNQKEIAIDFGDPVQYLYFLLLEKIDQNPSQRQALQTLLNKIEKKPNNFRDVLELYSELLPIMTEEEQKEFVDSCNRLQQNSLLTEAEKSELYWYSLGLGSLMCAYERGTTCKFKTTSNKESVYYGGDKDWCQKTFDNFKLYYMDGYLGFGEYNIDRSIAVVDRAINNATPLEKDTMLYRGLSGLYRDNELQSLESLWRQNGKTLLINDEATLSTSLTPEKCYTQHEYVLKILAPAGTKGIYIESNVKGYDQQEFLLPRNTAIKIYSVALDKKTGNITLSGKIVSQKSLDYKSDKHGRGINNVVDRLGLRHLDSNDSINSYNEQFNKFEDGIDVTYFIEALAANGKLDKFYSEAYDMDEIYEGHSSHLQDELLREQAQRVMLYSLYIASHLELSDLMIDSLLAAAKYHAINIAQNVYDEANSNLAITDFVDKYLKDKYPNFKVNRIAALIECLTVDESTQVVKIFNKYGIVEKEQNNLAKALSALKDAISLDKVRLQNGLDIRDLENPVSFSLVKTSYQIQEIRGKRGLDEGIINGNYSDSELEQIERYRAQEIPEYIIFEAISTSQSDYNSADDKISVWMANKKNRPKFVK